MKITSLSPSMVITHGICPRRFYYSEVARVPYLPNPDLAFGAAFHETIRETHYRKIQTDRDLPIDLLQDFFCADLEARDVDWSAKSLSKTKDEGVISVKSYMQRTAPSIHPAHVEHAWTMEVNGRDWVISGKTDLITAQEQVIEQKTTGKRVKKPKDDHVFQTGVYVAAWRAQTGLPDVQGRLDYSVRGKDEVCSIPVSYDGELTSGVLRRFDDAATWIQREMWAPNRHGNYLCSRKYCSFWNQCEKDCGGRVAE